MKHCLHRLVLMALCAVALLSIARAQCPAGIAFEFDSTARYSVEAGQTLQLAMRACDERQGTVENWDNIGKDVTLTVRGSRAETDTSTRSWNHRSRAFTWVHLKAGDVALRLDSPDLGFLPGPVENFLLEITSQTANANEVFSWDEAQPKDPYHNIRISRFDSTATYSDEVRYKIRIADAISLTRIHEFESDNHGRDPRWTARHHSLNAVIIQQSGLPTTRRWNVIWYVEATDGLYVTESRPLAETQIGLRMTLDRYEYIEVPVEALADSPDFTLHPNYPNPFNPGTVIPVDLHASGRCRLQVLDLMGKEVALLHDGFLEAGPHHFRFDARSLPSGVYSYRLIMDGATLMRPMLLLR